MQGSILQGATDEFFGGRQSDLVVLTSGSVIYAGDADPVLRICSVAPTESEGWGVTMLSERSTVKSAGDSPSITALTALADGSLIALGVTREEVSEVVLLAAPKTGSLTDLAAFKMEAIVTDLEMPVTSLVFGVFQEKKVLVFGTEEGLVERVEISSKRRTPLFKDSVYGGVKCVLADAKLPGAVFVSFCSGTVALIDPNGRILEKTLGFARPTTPDGEDRFSLSVRPGDSETPDGTASQLLTVGSQPVQRARFSNFRGAPDKATFGRWSHDGRFFASIKNLGRTVDVSELDAETGKFKQLQSFTVASELIAPLVSLAFYHNGDQHMLLLMSASGNKSAIVHWPGSFSPLRLFATGPAAESGMKEPEPLEPQEENDVAMQDAAAPAPAAVTQDERRSAGREKKKGEMEMEELQTAFQPGGTQLWQEHGKFVRKVLFWSGTGCVIRAEQRSLQETEDERRVRMQYRDEEEVPAVVEVYVSQTSVKLRDSGNGWDLAAVGVEGFVLGATTKRAVEDTYDVELDEEGEDGEDGEPVDEKTREEKRLKKKEKLARMGCLSKVSFRPFAGSKDWLAVLPLGESVVNVALLETSVAVATSTGDLRLYTVDGGVISDFFALGGRPVTMAAHKNTLFMVIDCGHNKLQYVLMSINSLTASLDQELARGDLPLINGSLLTWAHVAEDFVCYVADDELNVYGLFPRIPTESASCCLYKWSRVLNLARDCRRDLEGYWPVSVLERRLCCVVTHSEFAMEPKAFHTDRLVPFSLKLPLHYAHNSRLETPNPEAQLLLARLHTNHLMAATNRGLALDGVDEREVRKATIAHDKLLASIFRQYAEAGAVEKALGVAGGVFNPQSLNALLRLAATLNLRSLEDKLELKFANSDPRTTAPTAIRTPSGTESIRPRLARDPAEARQPEQENSEPATNVEHKKIVNPFAKRKADHDHDNGNKLPRAI